MVWAGAYVPSRSCALLAEASVYPIGRARLRRGADHGESLGVEVQAYGAATQATQLPPGGEAGDDRLFPVCGPVGADLQVGDHALDGVEDVVVDVALAVEVGVA